jgi:hypothetical protein
MIETLKLCRDRKMLLLIPVILYNGACQSRRRELLAYTARLAYLVRLAYALTTRGRRTMLLRMMPTQRSSLYSSTRAVRSGAQLSRFSTIQQPHSGCLVWAHVCTADPRRGECVPTPLTFQA